MLNRPRGLPKKSEADRRLESQDNSANTAWTCHVFPVYRRQKGWVITKNQSLPIWKDIAMGTEAEGRVQMWVIATLRGQPPAIIA